MKSNESVIRTNNSSTARVISMKVKAAEVFSERHNISQKVELFSEYIDELSKTNDLITRMLNYDLKVDNNIFNSIENVLKELTLEYYFDSIQPVFNIANKRNNKNIHVTPYQKFQHAIEAAIIGNIFSRHIADILFPKTEKDGKLIPEATKLFSETISDTKKTYQIQNTLDITGSILVHNTREGLTNYTDSKIHQDDGKYILKKENFSEIYYDLAGNHHPKSADNYNSNLTTLVGQIPIDCAYRHVILGHNLDTILKEYKQLSDSFHFHPTIFKEFKKLITPNKN